MNLLTFHFVTALIFIELKKCKRIYMQEKKTEIFLCVWNVDRGTKKQICLKHIKLMHSFNYIMCSSDTLRWRPIAQLSNCAWQSVRNMHIIIYGLSLSICRNRSTKQKYNYYSLRTIYIYFVDVEVLNTKTSIETFLLVY